MTLGDEPRGTGAKAPLHRKSWRGTELGAGVPEYGSETADREQHGDEEGRKEDGKERDLEAGHFTFLESMFIEYFGALSVLHLGSHGIHFQNKGQFIPSKYISKPSYGSVNFENA